MNALELADELIGVASVAKPTDDGVTYGLAGYCIKAATMLRQQHKELEHMWMANTVLQVEVEALKAKTLTDEEIYKIYIEVEDTKCPSDDFEYMMFARAILRKAQEK